MAHGYQCGMLWGAALAAGSQAYRLFGPGPQSESKAILAAQRLVEAFRGCTNDEINCFGITNLSFQGNNQALPVLKFIVKGGPIVCFRLIARYAPAAFAETNSTFSEAPIEAPSWPVSCAAVLAQKLGASDMHTVMAAGLAGGIGLSGGGCGALGAAIWIIRLKSGKEEDGKIGYDYPPALAALERFLQCTGNEFECSKIVGRKFENIADHAAYLEAGGCSKIIAALAAAG
jgi:hypothetical protein